MATKDLYNNMNIASLLDLSEVTADTNTDILDTAGIRSVVLFVVGDASGIGGGEKIAFTVKHGDDPDDMTAVTSDDLLGAMSDVSSNGTFSRYCGYCGSKRYVQVLIDVTGTLAANVAVFAIVDHAYRAPVSPPAVISAS